MGHNRYFIGGLGVGTGILNSADLGALKNKASVVEALHHAIVQGQGHQIAELVQTGRDTINLQWPTGEHVN